MLKRERHAFILHQVNLHNRVLAAELSRLMRVSDDTIRRDLQELSGCGQVIKVHGGALSPSFTGAPGTADSIYSHQQKRSIATKAADLVRDGMFVLTGGGTTILEFARALPPDLKATFVTVSIPAAQEYMNHPNIEVIFIGDKLSKTAKISVGSEAIEKIRTIRADLCLLGINALDLQKGVTDNDWDVVQVKRAMIAASRRLVCMTICEKLNTEQPFQVCPPESVHTLITECGADAPELEPFRVAGLQVL